MKLKLKNGRVSALPTVAIYFPRLNRYRRAKGLRAYTAIHYRPATRTITFGFKEDPTPC